MGRWDLRRAAREYLRGLRTHPRAAWIALAAALLSACGGDARPAPDRVVLVTIDTLRADRLGSYGARAAHTPHLDALAARGVRFDAAISPAPITLPAHASLLTGLDPPRHGVRHNGVHRLADGFPTLAEAMRSAGYATAAFVGARVLDRRFGLARGFDHYDDRSGPHSGVTVGYAERRAGEVVDAALAWLATAPPRCFLWLHVYDPHADYAPPPGFAAGFADRPYDGEIAYVDHSLGRLFAALATGSPERTVVAVTSDHGESLGEHGEATHSYTVYDATQRVPLILAGPGLPRGRVVADVVRLVDVAPTLLGLVGAAPLPGIDGASLLPLLGGSERAPRIAYVESLATYLDHGWSPLVGLRSERWKYVRAPRPELYDLREDPGETRDRAAAEPERVRGLDALLDARLSGERVAEPGPALAAEQRAQLRALGYAVPERVRASSRDVGPDPKDAIDVLRRIARAESLADRGDAAAALALLREIEPAAPAVLALRAALAVRARDYDAAVRDARALLDREPGREDVWLLLGRAREAQGRTAQAQRAYSAAAALAPEAEGSRKPQAPRGMRTRGEAERSRSE